MVRPGLSSVVTTVRVVSMSTSLLSAMEVELSISPFPSDRTVVIKLDEVGEVSEISVVVSSSLSGADVMAVLLAVVVISVGD